MVFWKWARIRLKMIGVSDEDFEVEKEEAPKAIEPLLLFYAGLVTALVGFGFAFERNRLLGNILWLIGYCLLIYSIRRNIKTRNQAYLKTFSYLNIAYKLIIVALLIALIIIANFLN
ncbi:MAG TPA: hypothetical protein ENN46_03260 [Candidatus Woesearchaeota archaeon]|nr:hypothetical protein [Candidatus Woesearchaeota archaeon]